MQVSHRVQKTLRCLPNRGNRRRRQRLPRLQITKLFGTRRVVQSWMLKFWAVPLKCSWRDEEVGTTVQGARPPRVPRYLLLKIMARLRVDLEEQVHRRGSLETKTQRTKRFLQIHATHLCALHSRTCLSNNEPFFWSDRLIRSHVYLMQQMNWHGHCTAP